MPGLACWSCGRQIYTSVPLASLFAEERRCPRCGATLHDERREVERRLIRRRTNPPNDPGPPASEANPIAVASAKPKATGKPKATAGADATTETSGDERRVAERRTGQRRSGGSSRSTAAAGDSSGWRD